MKITDIQVSDSRGKVTLESELPEFPLQIEELTSAACRNKALSACVEAGIKGTPGISRTADYPFPVNEEGEAIENLRGNDGEPLPPAHPRVQPWAYRVTYEITARP